ncbi:unnamed protein product [Cylindrotheca closterium]|uniref:PPM-type phosphatase domain-containing protein n=1 Tax=Cylindrotheca closterium TaxID=2856 RepID=A0AAD2CZ91_9STRA|nr:unnamed protein product [Cylindrotheca closterium]
MKWFPRIRTSVGHYFLLVCLLLCQASTLAQECPSYGCSLTPLDVYYSTEHYDALAILRSETASAEEQKQALHTLSPAGDDHKTTLTLKSYKGGEPEEQVNQDAAMVHSPFLLEGYEEPSQLLGVFDGHGDGGEITSLYAAKTIPKLLASKLASIDLEDSDAIQTAITETFVQVDQEDPTEGEGGCTATMILQLNDLLYIANAGDSQSFVTVFIKDEAVVVYESREDKPELEEEKARITEAGGYVHITADDSDVPRAYAVHPDGTIGTGLAMSRCLGDWENQGVIAEPIIDILNITEVINSALEYHEDACKEKDPSDPMCQTKLTRDDVHIMGASVSDGIIDFMETGEVADIMAPAFFTGGSRHPHLAAEEVVYTAGMMWDKVYNNSYRDDVTIAATKVFVGGKTSHEYSGGEL